MRAECAFKAFLSTHKGVNYANGHSLAAPPSDNVAKALTQQEQRNYVQNWSPVISKDHPHRRELRKRLSSLASRKSTTGLNGVGIIQTHAECAPRAFVIGFGKDLFKERGSGMHM